MGGLPIPKLIRGVRGKLRAFFFGWRSTTPATPDPAAAAIRPSRYPEGLSGYGQFCEHFAAHNDVGKALTADEDFHRAAMKAWFAVGYLTGLLHPDTSADRFGPVGAADDLAALLAWLKPVHDGAFDSATVDTATVLGAFEGYVTASLAGEQFRRGHTPPTDSPRTLTWEKLAPLPVDPGEVARISAEARRTIAAAAFTLGQEHGRLPPT
jgi:hypothetical protein